MKLSGCRSEHFHSQAEDEASARKLARLKQRIRDKGLPVRSFRSPEDLAHLVLRDWTRIIHSLHPPLEDLVSDICELCSPLLSFLYQEHFVSVLQSPSIVFLKR